MAEAEVKTRAELLEELFQFVWHDMSSFDPSPQYEGMCLVSDSDMAHIEELCTAIDEAAACGS